MSLAWALDVDTAIGLYELVGAPTPVDGDRRPTEHTNRSEGDI